MKNKTKVVVALASLLAVTSGIGAYSTFAWFTTTRTATVNVTSANVFSNYGKLVVAYGATQPNQGIAYTHLNGTAIDGVPPVTSITSTTNNVTDISGSGKLGEFYKPTWKPGYEGTVASAIPTLTNGSAVGTTSPETTDSYYVAFRLEFYNKGNVAINVYFDSTTALVAHQSLTARPTDAGTAQDAYDAQLAKDNAAMKSTRVAVYNDATEVSLWQQEADTHPTPAYNYIASGLSTDSVYSVPNFKTADATSGHFWKQGAFKNVTKDFEPDQGQLLCNVGTSSPVVLTFTSWIEGTLNEAGNDCIGGKVDLNLNFAALEA